MAKSSLKVSWQLSLPPLAARTWHRWSDDAVRAGSKPSQNKDSPLEVRLGWPPGTLEALRQGFARGLSRSVGWESSSEAVLTAARVFKRGVAARRSSLSLMPLQQSSGTYDVELTTAQPQLNGHRGASNQSTEEFFIIDAEVAKLWPRLDLGSAFLSLRLDEQSKDLEAVATILEAGRAAGKTNWCVIGGGLVTDVAAFAAAIAGASVRFVPTTLLAMADACVGGKTGVNFAPYGKNQIGNFYFPTAVTVWPGWLATLPERELRGGGAECIKHAFLRGDLELAGNLAKAIACRDLALMETMLLDVVSLKVDVVNADPAEQGMRAILNLGHTLAHALEALAQRRVAGHAALSHGEAVGVGLVFALILSRAHAGLSASDFERMRAVLKSSRCVVNQEILEKRLGGGNLSDAALLQELKDLLAHDKKNTGSQSVEWILLKAPGQIARSAAGDWTVSLPTSVIEQHWPEFIRILSGELV